MNRNDMDFGELANDEKFTNIVKNFGQSLDKIESSLTAAVETFKDLDELTTQEKVKLDNYLAYSINSLYWMYVKLQGLDPNDHPIKNELTRVKQTILRDKQIYERNTLRPRLDKAAAGRFIKHGLHIRFNEGEQEEQEEQEGEQDNETQSNTEEAS